MKNCIQTVAAVALMVGVSTVSAQAVYGEVGYVGTKVSSSIGSLGISAKPDAVRGLVGYQMNPNLSFEGMLAFGAGDGSINVAGIRSGLGLKIDNMVGAFVKPSFPIGDVFDLFGRVGYVSTKVSVDGNSDRSGSLSYGVGGSFRMTPALSLNVDYMIYHKKDDTKVDGYSVGVSYRF